jgi:hypothetical protein
MTLLIQKSHELGISAELLAQMSLTRREPSVEFFLDADATNLD